MGDERVLDASVAAAFHFAETGSAAVEAAVVTRSLIAPDLLWTELASVAAKKARAGDATPERAWSILAMADRLVDEAAPVRPLLARAFAIAAASRVSLYDAVYLAAAETRGAPLLTLDRRLARTAEEAGLGRLVELVA